MRNETRPVRYKEILVLDRDETWSLVMRDAIAGGGFRVSLSNTIEEVLRRIREERPDLLLLSSLMKDPALELLLTGLDQLRPSLPVVLVGLRGGETRWVEWTCRPYVTVVRQPFQTKDLPATVVALLGSTWEDVRRIDVSPRSPAGNPMKRGGP